MVCAENKTCKVCVCSALELTRVCSGVLGCGTDNKTQLLGKSNTVHSLQNSCLTPTWQFSVLVTISINLSDNLNSIFLGDQGSQQTMTDKSTHTHTHTHTHQALDVHRHDSGSTDVATCTDMLDAQKPDK